MCLTYKRADFESPVWLLRDRLGIQNKSASLNESGEPMGQLYTNKRRKCSKTTLTMWQRRR